MKQVPLAKRKEDYAVAAVLDETRPPEVTLVDSHVGDAAVVGGAAGKN